MPTVYTIDLIVSRDTHMPVYSNGDIIAFLASNNYLGLPLRTHTSRRI
jgi:hypothetical protein